MKVEKRSGIPIHEFVRTARTHPAQLTRELNTVDIVKKTTWYESQDLTESTQVDAAAKGLSDVEAEVKDVLEKIKPADAATRLTMQSDVEEITERVKKALETWREWKRLALASEAVIVGKRKRASGD